MMDDVKWRVEVNPNAYAFGRSIYFEGKKVYVKDTLNHPNQGSDFEKLRRDFLVHQEAARLGFIDTSKYILFSPRVYGRVGSFLVMEHIDEMPKKSFSLTLETDGRKVQGFDRIHNAWLAFAMKQEPNKSLNEAKRALRHNFGMLNDYGLASLPDVNHVMAIGQHKGKWVFYLPYDYTWPRQSKKI